MVNSEEVTALVLLPQYQYRHHIDKKEKRTDRKIWNDTGGSRDVEGITTKIDSFGGGKRLYSPLLHTQLLIASCHISLLCNLLLFTSSNPSTSLQNPPSTSNNIPSKTAQFDMRGENNYQINRNCLRIFFLYIYSSNINIPKHVLSK